jgi:prepilin-type N-terminal cleavage/methylation domain-containing protein
MKRQSKLSKSGFTLIELMIVIAILGIFFVATTSFNWKPRTNAERADLLSVAVSSRLREAIQNITIGRMPTRNGKVAKQAEITIGTGGMSVVYKDNTNSIITTENFLAPFIDNDKEYTLNRVTFTGAAISGHTVNGT